MGVYGSIRYGEAKLLAGFEMMAPSLDDVMGQQMWLNVPFSF